ncbi:sensor histidine kinase [Salimicrobium halophilum]|uniref:histidine kinase n=1 Tax=Salimicrobium halophilum TaxID=86666 RepID=A0A1G8TZT7_9BACI|nr:HAMP domain-containing sensor histidine kinase [Salimicrobium halophilum]SDJ46405.1 HAMP domain-containing protein [Salimicrobium halophilum]
MRRKLSVKLGLLFFVLMLLIELSLFFILYSTIASHRVTEVMDGLLAKGAGHRDVLENNYDESTLHHVILMEEEASTDVIITNAEGEIVDRSSKKEDPFRTGMVQNISPTDGTEDRIVEEEWRDNPYVATVSPIVVDGEHRGDVFMFSPSQTIREILSHLSEQFLFVMGMIVFITLILVFALSQVITRPLVRMQRVTEKLSEGKADLELDERHNDELGTLAVSINRLSEDLERLKKDRNNFLSSVAHELRTPLTYVKGYADVASRKETSEAERDKYLAIIREEADHLTSMVRQLFQLAKMEENAFVIEPSMIRLSSLFDEVETQIAPFVQEKQAELSIHVPEDLYVNADRTRMKQVIFNVLQNALQYGGERPSIQIEAKQQQREMILRISDKGPGVPEEALPRLFDRLYRVDKARSREQGGSGLGLAIVKEIVEMHGGTVKAFNENGLTILITLPEENDHDTNSYSG